MVSPSCESHKIFTGDIVNISPGNAVRLEAITWANVDPDLCRHMASRGHKESILLQIMACQQTNAKLLFNDHPGTIRCTILFQSGVFWDMEQVHCGIWELGLLKWLVSQHSKPPDYILKLIQYPL